MIDLPNYEDDEEDYETDNSEDDQGDARDVDTNKHSTSTRFFGYEMDDIAADDYAKDAGSSSDASQVAEPL